MSSNGSFEYEYNGDLDDLPSLVPIDTSHQEVDRLLRADEVERYSVAKTLTMIEISSCFRNGPEPLFDLLSPVLWSAARL